MSKNYIVIGSENNHGIGENKKKCHKCGVSLHLTDDYHDIKKPKFLCGGCAKKFIKKQDRYKIELSPNAKKLIKKLGLTEKEAIELAERHLTGRTGDGWAG